jgi:hypothetical protein
MVTTTGDAVPLSYSQRRLWFMDQLGAGDGLYHLPVALDLHGAVDHGALREAVRGVVARHEALRTRFPDTGGVPRQEVVADFAPPVRLVELTGADEDAELARISVAEAVAPFDLAAEVPLRALLVRGPRRSRLLITFHHILIDGWAVQTVLRELAALYRQAVTGQDARLGPVALQYPEYSRWQHELLAGPEGAELAGYWRGELAGPPPPLPLPTDRPMPRRRTFAGDTVESDLPADFTARIAALARRARTTPYMVHLAAFAAELGRWCGTADVVVGVPMACRTEPEHAELVGCTLNVVPLRIDADPAADLAGLAGHVRELLLDAFACQQLPLDRMVELFVTRRGRDLTPLFRVLCNHMGHAPDLALADGTTARVVDRFPLGVAKYDLTLHLIDLPAGARATVEYATELFDAPTVRGFLDRYLDALDAGTADRADIPARGPSR